MISGPKSRNKSTPVSRKPEIPATASRIESRRAYLTLAADQQPSAVPLGDQLVEVGSGLYLSGNEWKYNSAGTITTQGIDTNSAICNTFNGTYPIQPATTDPWTHLSPPRSAQFERASATGSAGFLNGPGYGHTVIRDEAICVDIGTTGQPRYHFAAPYPVTVPITPCPQQTSLGGSSTGSVFPGNTDAQSRSPMGRFSTNAHRPAFYQQNRLRPTNPFQNSRYSSRQQGLNIYQSIVSQATRTPSSSPSQTALRVPISRTTSSSGSSAANYKAKPYICEECEKAFAREDTLDRHIESMHGPDIFECVACKYQNKRRDKIKLHCRKDHQQAAGGEQYRLVPIAEE